MKIIGFLLFSLVSLNAIAHSGHGETSQFAHDLDHALWVVGGVVLVAIVFFVLRKRL